MKKRLPLLTGLLLVVIGLGFEVREVARNQEPRYSGKPISFWINEQIRGDNREAVFSAFAALGTNAIPFVMHELRRNNAAHLRAYQSSRNWLPSRIRRLLPDRTIRFYSPAKAELA